MLTIALLATVAVVAGVGVARAARRTLSDERSSVRDYQQTLETLRHLSDHRGEVPRAALARPDRVATGDALWAAGPSEVPAPRRAEVPRAALARPDQAATGDALWAAGPSDVPSPGPAEVPSPGPAEVPSHHRAESAPAPGLANGQAHEEHSGNGRSSSTGRRSRARSSTSSGRRARSPVLAARSGPARVTRRAEAPPEPARPASEVSVPAVPWPDVPVPEERARQASAPSVAAQSPPLAHATTAVPHATTAADAVRQLAASRSKYGSGPRRPAMPSTQRRERRPLLATAAAVVVVGTLTGVAVALHPAPHSVDSTPAVHHQAASRPAPAKKPPSTTVPSSNRTPVVTGLVPVTASTTEATYDVPGAPYSVSLSATGPCWVEAVDVASGQVLWEGTLEAGQTETVPATSGLFLRLGNTPDVTVTEGGQTVQLPAGYATVFNLTFVTA